MAPVASEFKGIAISAHLPDPAHLLVILPTGHQESARPARSASHERCGGGGGGDGLTGGWGVGKLLPPAVRPNCFLTFSSIYYGRITRAFYAHRCLLEFPQGLTFKQQHLNVYWFFISSISSLASDFRLHCDLLFPTTLSRPPTGEDAPLGTVFFIDLAPRGKLGLVNAWTWNPPGQRAPSSGPSPLGLMLRRSIHPPAPP